MGTWYEICAFFPMPDPKSLFVRLADEMTTVGIKLRGSSSAHGNVDCDTDWCARAAERWVLDVHSGTRLTSVGFVVSELSRPRSVEDEDEKPSTERINICGHVLGHVGRVNREPFAVLVFNIKGWEYFSDSHTRHNLAERFARIVGSIGLDVFFIGGPGVWDGLRRPKWPLDEAEYLLSGRLQRLYDWTYLGPDWWKKYCSSSVMRSAVQAKEAIGEGMLLECNNSPERDYHASYFAKSRGRNP